MKDSAKRFSSFISKRKVQNQLYLIFFAAIFIPVVLIGSYQVYSNRSQLTEHYEQQAYSENLRVRSILLDMTTSVYDKASYLLLDKSLENLLEKSYPSEGDARRAIDDFSDFTNLQVKTPRLKTFPSIPPILPYRIINPYIRQTIRYRRPPGIGKWRIPQLPSGFQTAFRTNSAILMWSFPCIQRSFCQSPTASPY